MPRKLYNTAVITNIYNVQLVNFLTPSSHTYWNLWRLLLSLLFFFFVFTKFFFHFALAPAVVVFLSYSWGERIKNSRVWASCSFSSTLSLSFSLSLWTSSFLFHSYASPCCHSFTPPAQLFVYVHSRRLFKKVFTLFPFAKFLYCCYFTSPTVSVSVPDTKNVRMTHEYVIAAVSNSYINAYVQYRYCFFCYHVHLSLGCWCFFPSFACAAAAAAIGVVVVFYSFYCGERESRTRAVC